jgi:hypothetical protein
VPKQPRQNHASLRFTHQKIFDKYLLHYEKFPSYKKVLSTMIKFKDMYRPIVKPLGFADLSGYVAMSNELRSLKKSQTFLNRRDLISTFDDVHGKRLVVTSRGRKIFYEDYPLAKLRKKPWDGVWTVVMYDFPEKERVTRNLIRRRLIKYGFGSPQISILVSPLPIEKPMQELLEGEKVSDKVWILRAKRILGMDNRKVVKKSWPLIDELNLLYGELLEVLPEIRKSSLLRDQWRSYFLAVNTADPYLPFELLPVDWKGNECEKEFVKLGTVGFLKVLFRFRAL